MDAAIHKLIGLGEAAEEEEEEEEKQEADQGKMQEPAAVAAVLGRAVPHRRRYSMMLSTRLDANTTCEFQDCSQSRPIVTWGMLLIISIKW